MSLTHLAPYRAAIAAWMWANLPSLIAFAIFAWALTKALDKLEDLYWQRYITNVIDGKFEEVK